MEGEDKEQTILVMTPTSISTTDTLLLVTNNKDDARTLVIASNTMPNLVHMCCIMLQWLELRHNQSILGFIVGNTGRAGDRIENNIMWKDIVEALQHKHQRGGVYHHCNNTKDKITEFHPDAPILLLQQLLLHFPPPTLTPTPTPTPNPQNHHSSNLSMEMTTPPNTTYSPPVYPSLKPVASPKP